MAKKASNLAVLSNQIEPEWHEVLSVNYDRHEKNGKTASMRVSYNTISGPYREWVCFEHKGFARNKAVSWYKRVGYGDVPDTVEDALTVKYQNPTRICTRQAGKFFEIIAYDFTEKQDVPFDAVEPEEWLDEIPF